MEEELDRAEAVELAEITSEQLSSEELGETVADPGKETFDDESEYSRKHLSA